MGLGASVPSGAYARECRSDHEDGVANDFRRDRGSGCSSRRNGYVRHAVYDRGVTRGMVNVVCRCVLVRVVGVREGMLVELNVGFRRGIRG